MKLSPDKTAVVVNEALTLAGIPKEAFDYRLGNRSALEWIIDQYQVSVDKQSGLVTDPNRADDPEYIVRLIARVMTVSVETVKLVDQLRAVKLGHFAFSICPCYYKDHHLNNSRYAQKKPADAITMTAIV